MKNLGLIVLFALITGLLSGCAGVSKKDCHTGSWGRQGYKDGRAGKYLVGPAFSRYSQSCSKYSLAPNKTEYEKGFTNGYRAKCRYATSRTPYDKTCIDINPNYNHEYTIRKIEKLEEDMRRLQYENRRLIRENSDLQYTIDRLNLQKN